MGEKAYQDRLPQHTGTVPLAEADRVLAEICAIMEETKLPFGPCVDIYIERTHHAPTALSA